MRAAALESRNARAKRADLGPLATADKRTPTQERATEGAAESGFVVVGKEYQVKGSRGTTLRFARLKAGLRQYDVARAAGCSRTRIGQVEQLRWASVRWTNRYQLAIAELRAAAAPLGGAALVHEQESAVPEGKSGTAVEVGHETATLPQ